MRSAQAIMAFVRLHERLLGILAAALVLVLLFGPTLYGHAKLAADPWVFADDVRVLIHPQFRLEDPTLFPGDEVVRYYLASLPDGYAWFYRLLGPLGGVVALSKALPYVLFALTLGCLGLASWRLSGGAALFGTLGLALGASYVLSRMVGGLPRGFAFPLMAAGALALVHGRARALAALCVLAAALYPVVGLTLGVALAGLLVLPSAERGCTRAWSLKKRVLLLAGTGVLCVLVLLPSTRRLQAWGPAIGPELSAQYPETGPLGRFDELNRSPFPALPRAALEPLTAALVGDGAPLVRGVNQREHASFVVPLLALLALAGWGLIARRRVEGRRLALLLGAMALCHSASLFVVPRLFLPERHVAYAVPVLALILLPSAFGVACASKRRFVRALPLAYNLCLLALLGARGVTWAGFTVHVPEAERPLHQAIARLPKNAVVAAFPNETSDSIPYLARRSVYLARETHMPFHRGFTDLMRARARALFRAYFTSSPDELRAFRDHEHVTHLLIDRRYFAHRPGYFAPFDADIAREFDAGKARGFLAPTLTRDLAVFESGDLVLLDLRRF